jgi:hypothetical protein
MKANTVKALLYQAPVILWQYMFIAMYLQNTKHIVFSFTNITILLIMFVLVALVSIFNDFISKKPFYTYIMIPITFIVILVFDKNAIAQIALFIVYISTLFFIKSVKIYKVENYYKNGDIDKILYKKFKTFASAKNHIENKLNKVLTNLSKNSKNIDELNQNYIQSENDYRIIDDKNQKLLFSGLWFVKKNSAKIFNKVNKNKMKKLSFPSKRGELPDDDRVVPNWMQIKNNQFDSVDYNNNKVDEIIKLSSEEFNEFAAITKPKLIFTYLLSVNKSELEIFFNYLDSVKTQNGISARDDFANNLEKIKLQEITDLDFKRATLEMPIAINYAKHIYHQATYFKKFIQRKYYPYQDGDDALQFEGLLFKTIYNEPMKFVPDYFEQILTHFKDYYDKDNSEHQKIGIHLAKRFGVLVNSLHIILKYQEEKVEGIEWFLAEFLEDIKKVNGHDVLSDDELIFYQMNAFSSIILENDDAYIQAMIDVVLELQKYYPFNNEAFIYALQELMKSVAVKKMNVENANNFIKIFEELPKLYLILSYEKIIELKNMISKVLADEKPQNNEIFNNNEVKNKIILLNYLIDMEDLYFESINSN